MFVANLVTVRNATSKCILIHATIQYQTYLFQFTTDMLLSLGNSKGYGARFCHSQRRTHVAAYQFRQFLHGIVLLYPVKHAMSITTNRTQG